MTNQHRATDEQWAQTNKYGNRGDYPLSSCIIELRDRIQQLEAAQQVPDPYAGRPSSLTDDERKATEEAAEAWARCAVEQLRSKPTTRLLFKTETTYGEASDHARRLVRNANTSPITVEGSFDLGGKSYTYKAQAEPAPSPQPTTLVERVARAIESEDGPIPAVGSAFTPEARTAIREVAAWLREHPGPSSAWSAVARDLEHETDK